MQRKDKQTESCGRLIAWPVENGTFGTGTDSSSNIHNPYWQYLNSIESSSRSELYHSRTGKMAAHRQHSPKRYLSSIPPWKPAGLSFSTPTKYPYLDASSPTPRLKKTTKKTSSKTTPPNASCVYGTVSVVDLQPLERMPCEKRVSFLESAIPTPEGISTSPSHEGTPGHVESPSPESTSSHVESPSPSHVESPSPEGTPSHVESPSSSHVESPSPEGTSNHVESPSPEGTPSHVESPSPEGTSSHTESPSREGTPSHIESPSPEGTPSHVESTPNHLGSTPSSEGIYESIVPQTAWWCGDIGKTSNGIQLLSEATKLSQCSDKLLKQLEEARKRMDARFVVQRVYITLCALLFLCICVGGVHFTLCLGVHFVLCLGVHFVLCLGVHFTLCLGVHFVLCLGVHFALCLGVVL